MDWASVFWVLAVANAVAGGAASVVAYAIARKHAGEDGVRRRTQKLYMASYILMSVSILCVALRGLAYR